MKISRPAKAFLMKSLAANPTANPPALPNASTAEGEMPTEASHRKETNPTITRVNAESASTQMPSRSWIFLQNTSTFPGALRARFCISARSSCSGGVLMTTAHQAKSAYKMFFSHREETLLMISSISIAEITPSPFESMNLSNLGAAITKLLDGASAKKLTDKYHNNASKDFCNGRRATNKAWRTVGLRTRSAMRVKVPSSCPRV
mmetsp:Transcript_101110/g.292388  ORF Transcript_101110/g.292388 Transcript_101110/m.292388 type:complete len:205 (+) Transcript_101110:664-1278(+)